MSFTIAKVEANHDANFSNTNNGGYLVSTPKGTKPLEKVGDKATDTPTINRASVQGRVNSDTWPA